MDIADFVQSKAWVLVEWPPEIDESLPERIRPKQLRLRVAYAPNSFGEDDLVMLALAGQSRVNGIDLDDLKRYETGDEENRAQKRARERAEKRRAATPVQKDERPTYLDILKRVLVDWDMTSNGEDIPLDFDIIDKFEPGLKLHIIYSVMGDYMERPKLMSLSPLFSGMTNPSGRNGQATSSDASNSASLLGTIPESQ